MALPEGFLHGCPPLLVERGEAADRRQRGQPRRLSSQRMARIRKPSERVPRSKARVTGGRGLRSGCLTMTS